LALGERGIERGANQAADQQRQLEPEQLRGVCEIHASAQLVLSTAQLGQQGSVGALIRQG